MRFDDLDKMMRVYEQSLDQVITPEMYMIARIDGRGFTRLTKEICKFEAPFDIRFRDLMIETTKALMNCGFRVIYGFTESDEISLLFHLDENTFGRKVRKYNSILASVAGAAFSLNLGTIGTFDCRMIPLPNINKVEEYFLWRQKYAHRNSLNSHCYWMLRKQGRTVKQANDIIEGENVEFKKELLFNNGINYNDLPNWQKRGVGIYWSNYEKEGFNPMTNESTISTRRTLKVDYDLPLNVDYALFI